MGIRDRTVVPAVERLRYFVLGLCAVATIWLAACGFALRTESYATQIGALHLDSTLPRDAHIAIERHAHHLAVNLVDQADTSNAQVKSIHETLGERATRVDPQGRAIEYLLSVRWDVGFRSQEDTQFSMYVAESVGLDERSLIGFEKEKVRLTEQLREELAEQLLRRIALLKIVENESQR